jgi:hypothetical protein
MTIAGIEPGPAVGVYKKMLSDAVVDGRIQADDKAAAETLLNDSL